MNKEAVIFLGILALLISGTYYFNSRPIEMAETANPIETKEGVPESKTILYYGSSCPHCKNVEEWLGENPAVEEKTNLISKEVYQNRSNSEDLVSKAQECNLDQGQGIGVPFLYDNGKCIMGDKPIITYLSENYL